MNWKYILAVLAMLIFYSEGQKESNLQFNCPPFCVCENNGNVTISCFRFEDVISMKVFLKQVEGNISEFEVSNSNIWELPEKVLDEIFVSILRFKKDNIYDIHKKAFYRQGRLNTLDLSFNLIKDVPKSTFKDIPNLKVLDLRNNLLTKLDDKCFMELENLKHLFLSNNRLTYIEHEIFPPSLEILFLNNNHLTELNECLKNVHSLKKISLKQNRIKVIESEFQYLQNLESLDLQRNYLSKIYEIFFSFPNPDNLEKESNYTYNVRNKSNEIVYFTNLTISHNDIFELQNDAFDNLVHLKILDLSYNKLLKLNPSLCNLKKLTLLHLNNNKLLTLEELDCEEGFPDLINLDLSNNDLISVNGINHLNLLKMQKLILSGNRMRNFEPVFNNLTALQFLDISENEISRIPEKSLIDNKELKTLNLNGNRWLCTEDNIKSMAILKSRVNIIGGFMCST